MKRYYFIFQEEKTGYTPYDIHCGTFSTLREARAARRSMEYYLTRRERESCTITICKADVPDAVGEDDVLGYACEHGYYPVK